MEPGVALQTGFPKDPRRWTTVDSIVAQSQSQSPLSTEVATHVNKVLGYRPILHNQN